MSGERLIKITNWLIGNNVQKLYKKATFSHNYTKVSHSDKIVDKLPAHVVLDSERPSNIGKCTCIVGTTVNALCSKL